MVDLDQKRGVDVHFAVVAGIGDTMVQVVVRQLRLMVAESYTAEGAMSKNHDLLVLLGRGVNQFVDDLIVWQWMDSQNMVTPSTSLKVEML